MADSLIFSWAHLISYVRCWFSWTNWFIFLLIVSFSESIWVIRPLYSLSYCRALDCCALESLIFSCAPLTSSPKPEFSCINFCIFFFNISDYWSLDESLSLYSFNYLTIFWFCEAESLRFYWTPLISLSIPVFSLTNLPILSWRAFIVPFIPFISWTWLLSCEISLFLLSNTPFSLSISWESKAILFSYSDTFLLTYPNCWSLLWSSSISLQAIFN